MTSTPMRAWVTCRFNESEGATTGREVRRVPGQLGQAAGSLIGLHRDSHRRNRLVCRPLRRRGSRERGGGVGAAGRGSEEWLQARAGGIAGSPQWKAPVSEDVSRAPPSTALLSIRSSPPPTLNGSSSSSSAFSIGRPLIIRVLGTHIPLYSPMDDCAYSRTVAHKWGEGEGLAPGFAASFFTCDRDGVPFEAQPASARRRYILA